MIWTLNCCMAFMGTHIRIDDSMFYGVTVHVASSWRLLSGLGDMLLLFALLDFHLCRFSFFPLALFACSLLYYTFPFFFWSFLYYDPNAIFLQPLARELDLLALHYTFGLSPHYGLRKVYIITITKSSSSALLKRVVCAIGRKT